MTNDELILEIANKLGAIAVEFSSVNEPQLVECMALTTGFMMIETKVSSVKGDGYVIEAKAN